MKKKNLGNLNSIRKAIQRTQLILIISITIFLSIGGFFINLNINNKTLNQNLQNTAELITRLYSFSRDFSQEDLCDYMDKVVQNLSDVDIISIIGLDSIRKYHTHHNLINTKYHGTIPDFKKYPLPFPRVEDSDYDFSFSGLKTAVINIFNINAFFKLFNCKIKLVSHFFKPCYHGSQIR